MKFTLLFEIGLLTQRSIEINIDRKGSGAYAKATPAARRAAKAPFINIAAVVDVVTSARSGVESSRVNR